MVSTSSSMVSCSQVTTSSSARILSYSSLSWATVSSSVPARAHDEAAVAEVGITLLAYALDAGEGAVLDGLLIKGAHDVHAALLIGLQDLRLVGDGELGLALGNGLGGLGGGLVGNQLQLVAGAPILPNREAARKASEPTAPLTATLISLP